MQDNTAFRPAVAQAIQRWARLRGPHPDYFGELADRACRGTIEDQDAIRSWVEDLLTFLRRIDQAAYARARVKVNLGFTGIHEFFSEINGGWILWRQFFEEVKRLAAEAA